MIDQALKVAAHTYGSRNASRLRTQFFSTLLNCDFAICAVLILDFLYPGTQLLFEALHEIGCNIRAQNPCFKCVQKLVLQAVASDRQPVGADASIAMARTAVF